MIARVMLGNGAVLLFSLAAGASLGCDGEASANDNSSALVSGGGDLGGLQAPTNVTVRRGPAATLEHSALSGWWCEKSEQVDA